ncbi:MAG: hypothetical protein MMC33_006869 [Icmadophila ericetorum]|nr:hypothetical protein [Icmadophila ericetorum]
MNEVCTFSGNGRKTATIGGYEIDTIASFDYSTIMLGLPTILGILLLNAMKCPPKAKDYLATWAVELAKDKDKRKTVCEIHKDLKKELNDEKLEKFDVIAWLFEQDMEPWLHTSDGRELLRFPRCRRSTWCIWKQERVCAAFGRKAKVEVPKLPPLSLPHQKMLEEIKARHEEIDAMRTAQPDSP